MSARAILYVEDDPNDALFVERAFARANLGARLFHVADGEAAIDYLAGSGRFFDRNQFPLPHLVVLDLKLGAMSGFDVLAWVRAAPQVRDVPVIIASSSDEPEDVARAKALGATDYVRKTFTFIELVETVQKLLEAEGTTRPESVG